MRNMHDKRFDGLYDEEGPEAGYRMLAIICIVFVLAFMIDILVWVSHWIRITFDTHIGSSARFRATHIAAKISTKRIYRKADERKRARASYLMGNRYDA